MEKKQLFQILHQLEHHKRNNSMIKKKLCILCYRIIFGLGVFYSINGCVKNDLNSKLEKTIKQRVESISQLPKTNFKYIEYYSLKRSVSIGETDIVLQLRSVYDSLSNIEYQIIVIINPSGQIYVIPFLSNEYTHYWNFKFDKISNDSLNKETFEDELQKAFVFLNFKDSIKNQYLIIDELFYSLLQCTEISHFDSLRLSTLIMREYPFLREEEEDSCFERIEKNYKEILSVTNLQSNSTYFDKKNSRVYQMKFVNGVLEANIYRQDCSYKSIDL
jgi:hypothetical protein